VLRALRVVLPCVLGAAALLVISVNRSDGARVLGCVLIGAGLCSLLMGLFIAGGGVFDDEREREEAARRYFAEHGYWPTGPRHS
jgi:hypothetical protein